MKIVYLHVTRKMFVLQICKLEEVIQELEEEREKSRTREEERELERKREKEQEKEKETVGLEPSSDFEFERLNEELKNTQHTIQQMQVCKCTSPFTNN